LFELSGFSIERLVEFGHGVFGEVAAGDGPLVVLVCEHSADHADDGGSLGKIPTTLERRLISLFNRSRWLLDQ
jgi:hypothetical protein